MKMASAVVAWLLALLGIEVARRVVRDAAALQDALDDMRRDIGNG